MASPTCMSRFLGIIRPRFVFSSCNRYQVDSPPCVSVPQVHAGTRPETPVACLSCPLLPLRAPCKRPAHSERYNWTQTKDKRRWRHSLKLDNNGCSVQMRVKYIL
ncbi:hypothetical protein PoB_005712900 [Plakobranchus ocellatus]|uniref:Uncharacterized protein n=1 Tax=Plakobranchus ocellatus TaxID=259542 RepID=A0AAV4CHE8_9GAST|nr:hypothetical protein PoB_005712900 [Plakobranchus ocellatus]